MPHLPDLEAWAIFAKVAEKGSFSAAAEDLGLAKTTVSKAVTRLEERMRTTLLHRTTRSLSLTESGRQSLERASRILADGAAIENEILEEAAIPRGLIRLACSTALGIAKVAGTLPQFMARYPEIEIDFCLTDNDVDIVGEGFDVAIQVGGSPDSSLRISLLFSFNHLVLGTPGFFDRHGRPEHPSELALMPAIVATHVAWSNDWLFSREGHPLIRVFDAAEIHQPTGRHDMIEMVIEQRQRDLGGGSRPRAAVCEAAHDRSFCPSSTIRPTLRYIGDQVIELTRPARCLAG